MPVNIPGTKWEVACDWTGILFVYALITAFILDAYWWPILRVGLR